MSKKKVKRDVEGYSGEVLEPEHVDTKEEVVADLETLATDLVTYIRNQEFQIGVMNTAHGPLYVLDPEMLDSLIVPIEENLNLPPPAFAKATAGTPAVRAITPEAEPEPVLVPVHEEPAHEEVIVPRESEMEMPREEEKHW